jgi:predicted RNA-binding protein with PUA-like domain
MKKRTYWLLKTEPQEWSWQQQVKSGDRGAEWNGVRNFQAAKNLRNMKMDDRCFFYHTGKSKSIIGIVIVTKEAFLDKSDKTQKFVSVIVKALYPLKREVSLKEIKKNKDFRDFSLVKQSRLSVMKFSLKYWKKICKMGRV